MRAVWTPLVGAFAMAMTTIALVPGATQAQQSVTINLTTQNDSGVTGTAVLSPDGSGTKVVLSLTGAPGPHPAHIHAGSCPTVGAVVFPLAPVANNRSETTVAASISDILKGPHAINVHKSPQEISTYVACGNLASAAAPPAAAKPSIPAVAASPAAAPAQAPRPAAAPAALPRTGEADPMADLWMVVVGGVAMIGAGVAMLVRRRSA